jgi:hypothetical protein
MIKRSRSDTDLSTTTGIAYFPTEICDDDDTMEIEDLNDRNAIKSLSNSVPKLWTPSLGTSYLWSCGPSPPPRSVSFASSDEGSDLMTPTSSSRGNRKRRSKISRPSSFRNWRQSDDDEFEFPKSIPPKPYHNLDWEKDDDSSSSSVPVNSVILRKVTTAAKNNDFVSKIDETDSEIDMTIGSSNNMYTRSRSRCSSSESMSADL